MKLTDLNPSLFDGEDGTHYLNLLCPALHKVWPEDEESKMQCTISLPIDNATGWQTTGKEDLATISVTPSVWHHCKEDPHFYITNGEIINC